MAKTTVTSFMWPMPRAGQTAGAVATPATPPPVPFSPDLVLYQIGGQIYVADFPAQISVPPIEADRRRLAKDNGIIYDEAPHVATAGVVLNLLFANGYAIYAITGPDPNRYSMLLAERQNYILDKDALTAVLGTTAISPEPAKPVPACEHLEEVFVDGQRYAVRFPDTIAITDDALAVLLAGQRSDRVHLAYTNGEATYLLGEVVPSLNGTLAHRLYMRIDFPAPASTE